MAVRQAENGQRRCDLAFQGATFWSSLSSVLSIAPFRCVCPASEIYCERSCANDIDAASVDINDMLSVGRIDRVALIILDTETWRSVAWYPFSNVFFAALVRASKLSRQCKVSRHFSSLMDQESGQGRA
jgi:hypothetical protein